MSASVDVYALGMCALEMAALEVSGNGDSGHSITKELVRAGLALARAGEGETALPRSWLGRNSVSKGW